MTTSKGLFSRSGWALTAEEIADQYVLEDAEIPMSVYDTKPRQAVRVDLSGKDDG